MKSTQPIHLHLTLLLLLAISPTLLGQGNLTPPGAPAPTMKTLDQVEPRTPLSAVTGDSATIAIISLPGVYYATTNLIAPANFTAIKILTNDVTIDLNGFTLTGNSNMSAIFSAVPGVSRIRIQNGRLVGWNIGIYFISGNSTDVVVEDVRITTSGASDFAFGIGCGDRAQIRRCFVSGVKGGSSSIGIYVGQGSIVESTVLESCYAGLVSSSSSVVARNCQARNCLSDGFLLNDKSVIENCQADGCKYGFDIGASSVVLNNTAMNSTNGSGFSINASFCRVEGNLAAANSNYGFLAQPSSTNNFFVRNIARGNGVNFSVSGSQVIGPIITGTGTITTNNPWANFSY
jgi:hypothetical protein